MRLFVPLDVDFASDDKILAAGPMAAYLFVCSLALSKRTLSDGFISRNQLGVLTVGFGAKADKHADRLVQVGLWEEVSGGWRIPGWSKRNMAAAEVEKRGELKRQAAAKANHSRWHIGGRTAPDCPFCPRKPDSGSESVWESIETEEETEEETETQDGISSICEQTLVVVRPVDESIAVARQALHPYSEDISA